MGELLERRRDRTRSRLQELQSTLSDASELVRDKACVYLTGSFGRHEASAYSDLDLFIAGRCTPDGGRALSRLDEICVKADLIEAVRALNIPPFSGDGEYLVQHTVKDLARTLGTPEDDASNTFTARLLLLLESQPLLENAVYEEAIEDVVGAYWRDYEDHKNEFIPAFLANDILRLWRTFCVNYEARTLKDPPEKKAKRKLKNYKLKHSRLLTCYSGLLWLLAVHAEKKTVHPADVVELVHLTPTERLESLATRPLFTSSRSKVDDVLGRYETFLQQTEYPEDQLIAKFMSPSERGVSFENANALGDAMYALLTDVGPATPLFRLLVV